MCVWMIGLWAWGLGPVAFSAPPPLRVVPPMEAQSSVSKLEADQLFDELTGHPRVLLEEAAKSHPASVRLELRTRFARERARFVGWYEQISPVQSADDFEERLREISDFRLVWESSSETHKSKRAQQLREAIEFAIISTWKHYLHFKEVQQTTIDAQMSLPERERSTFTLTAAKARIAINAWTFHRRKKALTAIAGQEPFKLYAELDPLQCQDLLIGGL